MYSSSDPFDGLLVFGALAIWGIWIIFRGLRGDIGEWTISHSGTRWIYITFGVLIQIPLLLYLIFLWRMGHFDFTTS